jgi:hypothetical protein
MKKNIQKWKQKRKKTREESYSVLKKKQKN